MRKHHIILLLLCSPFLLKSQDAHFTNFLDSLRQVLPTLSGNEWLVAACDLSWYLSINGATAEEGIELAQEGIKKLPKGWEKDLERLRDKTAFLNNLANAHNRIGQYEKAQSYVNEGLEVNKLIRPFNDSIALYKEARFRLLAAEILYYQRHIERQIAELRKAAATFKRLGNDYNQAGALSNIGSAYRHLEQYDSAVYYFQLCDSAFLAFGFSEYLENQVLIGEALLRKGDLEHADSLYHYVIKEGEKDNFRNLKYAYVGLGEIQLAKEQPKKALEWFEKARPFVEVANHPFEEAALYELFAEAYEATKEKERSLEYYQKYIGIYEALTSELYGEELIQLQQELEVAEKNEKIMALENTIWEEKIINRIIWFFVILALIGGGLWLRKFLKERQRPTVIEWSALAETISEQQDPFMSRIMEIVNTRLADSNLTVESLATEMCISRVQLFKKVKEHFATSPSALIRQARLEKAKLLLERQKLNVSEVAYQVGFVNASHFTRVFRKHFGYAPSEIFAKNSVN